MRAPRGSGVLPDGLSGLRGLKRPEKKEAPQRLF